MLFTWTGLAGDDNFNNADNWQPQAVPGSTDDAVITLSTATIITVTAGTSVNSLSTSAAVTVDVAYGQTFTIEDAATTVDPSGTTSNGGTIFVADNAALDLYGLVVNSGLIAIDGTYYGSALNIENAVSLSGGGTLTLIEVNGSDAINATSGGTLDNINNLIEGVGNIGNGSGLVLLNSGIIDADGTAHGLIINASGGVTNTGLLESTTANGLFLDNQIANAGTIAAYGSGIVVLQGAADIVGGTLVTSGAGVIDSAYGNNSTLDGVQNTGQFLDSDNSDLHLRNTLTNNGTLAVDGTYYGAYIDLDTATVTLNGGGTLNLLDVNGTDYIRTSGTATLVNLDNLIEGVGNIGNGSSFALLNASTIDATGTAHALTINAPDGVTNTGLIESTTSQGLFLDNTIQNAGGTIGAFGTDTAVVLQNGADVIGGTLSTGGGVIETPYGSNGTLDTVLSAAALLVSDNSQLHLRGTLFNTETLTVDGTYYGAQLYIDTPTVTLSGGGVIALLDVNGTGVITTSGVTTLDNVNNLIAGAGNIGNGNALALINASTIDATGTAHALTINAGGGVINTGLIESTTAFGLFLDNTIANTGGTIAAFGSSTAVVLTGADIIGGTLTTGGGVIETPYGNNGTLDTLLNLGQLLINDNSQLHLRNTLTNAGTLTIDGTYYGAQLYIDTATVTLDGGGLVAMLDINGTGVITTSGATTLDNVDNLIEGAGNIGNGSDLTLINASTIDATGTAHALTINAGGGVINTGLIESTTAFGLFLDNRIGNAGGTIAAFGSNTAVVLTGADIIGGSLTTTGGGVIEIPYGNNGTLDTLLNRGQLLINDNGQLHLRNTLTNSGTLVIDGTYFGADLFIDTASVTLDGGGQVAMLDVNGTGIITTSGATTLDNVDNLIEGAGNIGNGSALGLINAGMIDATGTAHALTIDAGGGVTNTGLIESTSKFGLYLDNRVANAGGTIGAFGANTALVLTGADIVGGTLTTGAGGVIEVPYGNNGTLDGAANSGQILINDNAQLHLRNNLSNTGTLAIDGTYFGAQLYIDTTTSLTGGGVVDLLDINDTSVITTAVGATLDNVDNLIEGAGNIGQGNALTLVNAGTILANGTVHGLIVQAGGGVTNTGLMEADAELQIQGNVNGAGELLIEPGALFDVTGTVGLGAQVTFGGAGAVFETETAPGFAGTLDSLIPTDIIELPNSLVSSATIVGAALDIVLAAGGTLAYALANASPYDSPVVQPFNSGSEIVINSEAPCYCRGTRVLTDRGERAVEDLSIGDRLITRNGEARALRWIGRRSYAGRFAARNHTILPVLIRAGALADSVPQRDLYVSPLHAMYLDDVLVPALQLVNGVTIVQLEAVALVEYFHLELDTHDVIVAEGAWSESFVDDDSRCMFHNAADYDTLYPDAPRPAALYCAPRVTQGYALEAIRRRLAVRAGLRPEQPAEPLRGFVDRVGSEMVEGWAQNPERPDMAVCVDVLVEGVVVAQTLANRFRADLAAAGLGQGRHGFAVRLPFVLSPRQRELTEVRRSLDQVELARHLPARQRAA